MSTKKKKLVKKLEREDEMKYNVFCIRHPVNMVLHVMGLIIFIYSLWFHKLQWVPIGLIPILAGHIYQYKKWQ